ncbi:MAG: TRAM domain-containing protein [Clostridia bacterium]|nr:TRAM domain-containing protein [Clostridia bacterium]
MKSKQIQRILWFLMLCLGAGAGVALAFLCVQVHRMTNASGALNLGTLVLLYGGMGALGALMGHLLSPRLITWCSEAVAALEKHMDTLSLAQLAAMCTGLITGFLIAALLTQVLDFLGDSIFTLAFSAMLYVVLGVMGLTIGKRRTEDFAALLSHLPVMRERRSTRRTNAGADNPGLKVLDGAVMTDGRLEAVCRTGFVEGELLLPDFVLEELRQMAESADATRRVRGRRGLAALEHLQADEHIRLRVEHTDRLPLQETDVRLLSVVRDMNASLLTSDLGVSKMARAAGLPVLNLNDLACALRTVTAAGDVLAVRITKEGREAGQGVGYLEDGTMIVIEGGSSLIGETAEVTVSSVLQTNAGRMVFARVND